VRAGVERGDIVVFRHEYEGQLYDYIWRVVGLPGDVIEASGDSLIVNGQSARRQRLRESGGETIYREQIGDGDNRFLAEDSRYTGPIAFGSISGRKL
jgi:signal peptidase I